MKNALPKILGLFAISAMMMGCNNAHQSDLDPVDIRDISDVELKALKAGNELIYYSEKENMKLKNDSEVLENYKQLIVELSKFDKADTTATYTLFLDAEDNDFTVTAYSVVNYLVEKDTVPLLTSKSKTFSF